MVFPLTVLYLTLSVMKISILSSPSFKLVKCFQHFSLWMKQLDVTISMKNNELFRHVVMFIKLYKVVLLNCVDVTLVCVHLFLKFGF